MRDPRGAPVVVESEYAPARTVEQDAVARLGRVLADSGDEIEQCLALRAPDALRHAPQAALDERPFERTQVHLLPYGRQGQGDQGDAADFALGALDLIRAQHGTGLFERTGIAVQHGTAGAAGVDRQGEGWSDTFLLAHRSMDLVIMNPPFTRPTNHEAADVPVPSFAGLGNDDAEQAAMSALLKGIRKEIDAPAGHGNAGLASNFLDLAEAKVKPGGVLALVMPLSLLQGNAWEGSRELLRSRYEETTVISLASAGRDEQKSFSADTGMGEVLVVARHPRAAGDVSGCSGRARSPSS